MQITINQLENILRSRRGAFPITIKAVTKPTNVLPNCPFQDLTKVSTINAMGGWIYEQAVNRQRIREDKEPDFTPFPRRWGTRVRGTPFVEHEGKLYFEAKVQKRLETAYFSGQQAVGLDRIQPFLRNKEEGISQQVEAPIVLRDYLLENIVAVRVGGEEYEVIGKNFPVGLDRTDGQG